VAVPVAADAPKLGQGARKIRLKENLGLSASLIRNSLINYLVGLPRTVLNYDPIRFIAQDDILRSCVPSGIVCPEWLSVRLLYEMAVRPIYFFKHKPFIAAVFDVRITRVMDCTVGDLIKGGFSPVGYYVATRVSRNQDPRIAPRHELIGKVESVSGSKLVLTDSKGEIPSVDASDVWLEKRAFPACLAHAFKGNDEVVAAALEKAMADLRSGPTKLKRLNSVVEFFESKQHYLAPGIPFKFSPLLSDDSKGLFPTLEMPLGRSTSSTRQGRRVIRGTIVA
jgi:hypothetical protein